MSDLLDNLTFFGKSGKDFKNLNYPLKLRFKIGTLANDFSIEDSNGKSIAYVRQKMFKFIDEIQVYTDSSKNDLVFTIKANKWIDFSAAYTFTNSHGKEIGRVGRKGWASIWKARYDIFDDNQQLEFQIQEENAWTKVWDGLMGEIPVVSMFTGYMFNPKYMVKDTNGNNQMRLKKDASFFGRQFSVTKENPDLDQESEEKILLSLMMMILLERKRG